MGDTWQPTNDGMQRGERVRVKKLFGGYYNGSNGKMRRRLMTVAVEVGRRSWGGGEGEGSMSSAGGVQAPIKQNINNCNAILFYFILFYFILLQFHCHCQFNKISCHLLLLCTPVTCPQCLNQWFKTVTAYFPPFNCHCCCCQPSSCSGSCRPVFIHVLFIHSCCWLVGCCLSANICLLLVSRQATAHHPKFSPVWYCTDYGKINDRKFNLGNSISTHAILGKGGRYGAHVGGPLSDTYNPTLGLFLGNHLHTTRYETTQ